MIVSPPTTIRFPQETTLVELITIEKINANIATNPKGVRTVNIAAAINKTGITFHAVNCRERNI